MGFNIFYKIFFVLSLISIPLYVTLLSTIIRFREQDPFNSSFFTLCFGLGVVDLISLTNMWVLYRSCLFGWFGMADYAKAYDLTDRFLPKLCIMITWFCGLSQCLCLLASAVNRLTAIVYTHKHDLIWTPKRTGLIIALTWIVPALLVAPQGFQPFGYVIDNQTGDVHANKWMNREAEVLYYGSSCIYLMVINVICFSIYLRIAVKVKKHKNAMAKSKVRSNTNMSTADIKLASYGFCMFIILFLYTAFSLYMVSGPEEEDFYRAIMIYTGMSDVYSWSNPWFILIFSKATRQYMSKMITCKPANDSKQKIQVKVQPPRKKNIVTPLQENDQVIKEAEDIEMDPVKP